jgi:hypothetical protein
VRSVEFEAPHRVVFSNPLLFCFSLVVNCEPGVCRRIILVTSGANPPPPHGDTFFNLVNIFGALCKLIFRRNLDVVYFSVSCFSSVPQRVLRVRCKLQLYLLRPTKTGACSKFCSLLKAAEIRALCVRARTVADLKLIKSLSTSFFADILTDSMMDYTRALFRFPVHFAFRRIFLVPLCGYVAQDTSVFGFLRSSEMSCRFI